MGELYKWLLGQYRVLHVPGVLPRHLGEFLRTDTDTARAPDPT
jgi:hypothetical protein